MVIVWPLALSEVLVLTSIVLVNTILPSQANATGPPPAIAARRSASVQLVTVAHNAVPATSHTDKPAIETSERVLNSLNNSDLSLSREFMKTPFSWSFEV